MRSYKQYVLDAFQRDALDAIQRGMSVIVAAPTGCGKTLVAEYAIERALERGERIVYTAPIKALSNQKFRDFGAIYGDRVGIMTGDVTINPGACAVIMTTEIFRNTIFDNPARLKGIQYVILDEAHYLDDPERGTVWEESIIFAPPEIRFIALSATISNLSEFASWIRNVRPGGLRVVLERHRPVPLHPFVFAGDELLDLASIRGRSFPTRPHHGRDRRGGRPHRGGGRSSAQQSFRLIDRIEERGHFPCIFFLFSREMCEKMAQACASRDLLSADEAPRLAAYWEELRRDFDLAGNPSAERLGRLLCRGIAYHHAGMLPTLKEVVERLFTSGLLKLLFATETFSLGVNMPARAVSFESLKKFDGVKRDYMRTREFLQMAGRAGRRGKDKEGFVYTCVDPQEERPSDVRRVMEGEVEAVESQFNLSYATLLALYSHLGEGIYRACEQSFIHFRHRRRKGAPFLDMISLVKKRIRLLQETGYLDGERLTTKGRFASLIYGYEIQTAELWAGGLLESLGPRELAVLATALVYESKRDTWFVPLARETLEPLRRPARDLIDPFRERELAHGMPVLTKRPDWGLSRAIHEWTSGRRFEELLEFTAASPGDIVRTFRLGIQLLRQIAKPLRLLPGEPSGFRSRLREAAFLVKRGEVDAERQLRQTVRAEAGDEALARIPSELDLGNESAEGDARLDHLLERPSEPVGEIEIVEEEPPRGELSADPREAPPAAADPEGRRPHPRDFGWVPADEDDDAPGGKAPRAAPVADGVEEVPAEREVGRDDSARVFRSERPRNGGRGRSAGSGRRGRGSAKRRGRRR